ncbi:hypothetical protein CRM76_02055 [Edwardsiella tarda]|uniref:Uncharacterized protein n=1 Tax=Edwardsiella tarda TaxID=636 RepID=A0A2A7U6U4_EDWTA|nr:hypothetical protein CRM76_02055 [Edwardsiella tarda]
MNSQSPDEFFAWRVAEAYLLHLVSIHRRPVYRHEAGDIEVDRNFLTGLLDGYIKERHPPAWRARFCIRLLRPLYELPDNRVVFVGGRPPMLNRLGIRHMNALVCQFADMLVDMDLRDGCGMLRMPSEEEMTARYSRGL